MLTDTLALAITFPNVYGECYFTDEKKSHVYFDNNLILHIYIIIIIKKYYYIYFVLIHIFYI